MPVVRTDKETTKIRALVDASCSYVGPSLIECLYPGLNLLVKIFYILINYVLIRLDFSSIQQLFVQVSDQHKEFLKFLWYGNSKANIDHDFETVVYRFSRVVFAVKRSPFLLNATVRRHLKKHLPE